MSERQRYRTHFIAHLSRRETAVDGRKRYANVIASAMQPTNGCIAVSDNTLREKAVNAAALARGPRRQRCRDLLEKAWTAQRHPCGGGQVGEEQPHLEVRLGQGVARLRRHIEHAE